MTTPSLPPEMRAEYKLEYRWETYQEGKGLARGEYNNRTWTYEAIIKDRDGNTLAVISQQYENLQHPKVAAKNMTKAIKEYYNEIKKAGSTWEDFSTKLEEKENNRTNTDQTKIGEKKSSIGPKLTDASGTSKIKEVVHYVLAEPGASESPPQKSWLQSVSEKISGIIPPWLSFWNTENAPPEPLAYELQNFNPDGGADPLNANDDDGVVDNDYLNTQTGNESLALTENRMGLHAPLPQLVENKPSNQIFDMNSRGGEFSLTFREERKGKEAKGQDFAMEQVRRADTLQLAHNASSSERSYLEKTKNEVSKEADSLEKTKKLALIQSRIDVIDRHLRQNENMRNDGATWLDTNAQRQANKTLGIEGAREEALPVPANLRHHRAIYIGADKKTQEVTGTEATGSVGKVDPEDVLISINRSGTLADLGHTETSLNEIALYRELKGKEYNPDDEQIKLAQQFYPQIQDKESFKVFIKEMATRIFYSYANEFIAHDYEAIKNMSYEEFQKEDLGLQDRYEQEHFANKAAFDAFKKKIGDIALVNKFSTVEDFENHYHSIQNNPAEKLQINQMRQFRTENIEGFKDSKSFLRLKAALLKEFQPLLFMPQTKGKSGKYLPNRVEEEKGIIDKLSIERKIAEERKQYDALETPSTDHARVTNLPDSIVEGIHEKRQHKLETMFLQSLFLHLSESPSRIRGTPPSVTLTRLSLLTPNKSAHFNNGIFLNEHAFVGDQFQLYNHMNGKMILFEEGIKGPFVDIHGDIHMPPIPGIEQQEITLHAYLGNVALQGGDTTNTKSQKAVNDHFFQNTRNRFLKEAEEPVKNYQTIKSELKRLGEEKAQAFEQQQMLKTTAVPPESGVEKEQTLTEMQNQINELDQQIALGQQRLGKAKTEIYAIQDSHGQTKDPEIHKIQKEIHELLDGLDTLETMLADDKTDRLLVAGMFLKVNQQIAHLEVNCWAGKDRTGHAVAQGVLDAIIDKYNSVDEGRETKKVEDSPAETPVASRTPDKSIMNKEQKKTSLFAHWGRKMHTSSKGPIRSVARDNTIAGFLKVTMFNIPGLAGGNQVVDTATGSLHKAIGVSLRIKDYVRFGTAFITNRLIKGWANLTGQERKGANRAVYNPVSHTMNGKKVEILSKQPQRW